MDFEKISLITSNFFDNSKLLNIDFIDSGLINKTYIIEHLINGEKSKFVLQCLSNIFESYEKVNMNHKLITNHIKNKIKGNYLKSSNQRWEVPCLIKCNSNNLFGAEMGARNCHGSDAPAHIISKAIVLAVCVSREG